MSLSTLTTIEKLKGQKNYGNSQFNELEGLWTCISIDNVSTKDTQARSRIALLVDPINYVHIQSAKIAKQVWLNLEKIFQNSTEE